MVDSKAEPDADTADTQALFAERECKSKFNKGLVAWWLDMARV